MRRWKDVMRLRSIVTSLSLAGSLGCSMLSDLTGPAAVLPSRAMQRVLPVPRLVSANEAVGSCVRFAADGSFILEACPPALAGMADKATEYKAPKGEHEAGILIVDPRQPPPGFAGTGGYWHVREAHVTRVLTSQVGSGRLGTLDVDRLDALCQDVRSSGDRVVVDRAYVGCAVIADGTGPAPVSSEKATEQLKAQGRRLGAPKDFRIDGGDGPDAACDGDETTVLVGVVALSTICNDIVRDAVLTRATKEAATVIAEIEKTKAELASKQQARPPGDARERNGRERVAALGATYIALDLKVEALSLQWQDAQEKVQRYRGDPYGLRSALVKPEDTAGDRVAQH